MRRRMVSMVGKVVVLCWCLSGATCRVTGVGEDAPGAFWLKLGQSEIEEALKDDRNVGVARNVILFVGDGMGMSTITAGRIFKGQLNGHRGEEAYLTFEKFRNTGLLKTYNVDRQVPDSAATATALFSGVKANYYTVGLDGTATFNVCRADAQRRASVDGLMAWGIDAGKSTGVVTTTRVTHATPAAAYAHCTNRDWECDSKIPREERKGGCKDIARQLVEEEPGRSINVILGGGEQTLRASVPVNSSSVCFRGDGKDLIEEWKEFQQKQQRQFSYVSNRQSLLAVNSSVDYLLGTFGPGHLPYDKDRTENEPSLEEMTTKAIEVLSRNSNGFLLIVEGGRIDHAHHDNLAEIAMEEMVAFDRAIAKALQLTNAAETLIVVTADHSHAFVINGYPVRGNPIAGLGDVTPEGYHYETLSYINGPGYTHHRLNLSLNSATPKSSSSTLNTWKNLTEAEVNRTTPHLAGFWTDYESHGGEDVPVYANGPMAHLFPGVHEQTHVAHVIAYSACVGPYYTKCVDSGRIKSGGAPAHHGGSSPTSSAINFQLCLFLVFSVILTQK